MRVSIPPNLRSRKPLAVLAGGALTLSMVAAGAATTVASAAPARTAAASAPGSRPGGTCSLDSGTIKHVIYLQFDNVHFSRDNPRVPSDLEQMPNLLHFITGNGTLITHEHTPLIAHTADDIVTSESGLYGDRQGVPIANEYHYYTGAKDGSSDEAGSFAYWTDPIVDYTTNYAGAPVKDSTTTLIGPNGKTPPAPWVPYTRAGCDVGSVAAANTELENQAPDVAHVFGPNSPDAAEGNNPNLSGKAAADYEGLSVHCAKGSAVCTAHHSVPDLLPDEPGGYHGYRALFGAKYINAVLNPAGKHVVKNFNGKVIEDSSGDIGFPGYDSMQGYNSLAYTLDMQTHGIPVTFTYLTDLHDSWITGAGMGPGEAQYETQLRAENAAFGTFFAGLARHGITKANTLFVITSDEGDHFVGGPPSPAHCNGVKIPCTYKNLGEVDGDLTGMLAAKGVTTPFDVQADSAPIVYAHGQPARGNSPVRALERAAAAVTADDLATGKTVKLIRYMADPVEMKLLHMITGDPKRTATVALFGNPDFWLSSGSASCGTSCVSQPSGGDAWNHGDVSPQINTTWLGVVGPGVKHQGVNSSLWSDHTNIQPTMMALLRLHDDYTPDGRVLAEIISPNAMPKAMRAHFGLLIQLGDAYSQLNADVGAFGLDTLRASTKALESSSPGDATYKKIENALITLGMQRETTIAMMKTELYGAAFGGHPLDVAAAKAAVKAANGLISQAAALS